MSEHNAAIDEALAVVDDRLAHWRWKRESSGKPRGMIEEELLRLRDKILARKK